MKIDIELTPQSIAAALAEVNSYRNSIKTKVMMLARKLADYGQQSAQASFDGAQYDGSNRHVDVTVEEIDDGYAVIAKGEAVCFIEFGAGVHYNATNRNYPLRIPEGVVDIGEYGFHHGRQDSWTFMDLGGRVTTHGNPPSLSMATASDEMRQKITEFAREVFCDS